MLKRKQITFDLDTNILKQIHGEKNYTKAYSDIRNFMENNDFEHIEGSVYASTKSMSNQEIIVLIKDLKKEHEYLDKSVREIHQADIGESHSLTGHFNYDGTPGKFAQKNRENEKESDTPSSESEAMKDKPAAKNTNLSKRFAAAETLTANISGCQTPKNDEYNLI